MATTLFVNACVREESRTRLLADEVLKDVGGAVVELQLEGEALRPLCRASLKRRDELLRAHALDDPILRYARQFADAEEIVIAAPYWDLSFPALLKIYFEQVTVSGITFFYENGRPRGLCRARRLHYVTTAGGPILHDFGYSYVKTLANDFYGIPDTVCVRAENLDVAGITAEHFLRDATVTTLR